VAAGPRGTVPAAVLRTELAQRRPDVASRIVTVLADDRWPATLAQVAATIRPDDMLVIWPGDNPTAAVAAVQEKEPAARMILFASRALPAAIAVLKGPVSQRARLMHPTELPDRPNPLSFRVRGWLHARGIAAEPPELQFKIYYALSVLDAAVGYLLQDFYRDYMVERIEQEAESNLNPGMYPTLSLGPGQRFASRGSYVVRLDHDAPDGIRPVGDWIVP
jgi:hypothetical protein